MTRKFKMIGLNVLLVDGRSHHRINVTRFQIFNGSLK